MYMEIDGVERERRRKAVAAEIACLALDGGRLAAERLAQLQRYVDGRVSLQELRAELIERLRLDDEGIADEDEMRRAWGDLE
ncbi:antitoxin VbhA family protein [Pseudomonas japonica]|uniref:antitoxin VbhA family protein n=1 Tax=Pseudomonas japonica TaxID=256466 RepID=UPI0005A90249|nr:antitoxin VbhA family protein [Pseudomonas japonica]